MAGGYLLLTNKYPLPFPLSIPPKFDCLSAGKREHMTEKGKHLYNLFGKRQRAKEKSLLYRLLIRTFTQGFCDRLLSKGKLFFDKPGLNNRVNSKYVDKNNQRTQPRKKYAN